MRKFLAGCGALLVVFGVSGCGGATGDSVMKENIALMNEMAEAIEKDAPQARLDELKKKGDEIKKRADALKISEEDQKKLAEKYKDEISKAMNRLMAAAMKKAGSGGMPDLSGFGK